MRSKRCWRWRRDRRGLSAHESRRRRRVLAHPRAFRARARDHGGRPGRRGAARVLSRARNDSHARAARGAHRAGRRRRLDAGARSRGRAMGGRLPLGVLLAPAIGHARKATRSRAARRGSPTEKLSELKACRASPKTFLIDGKAPSRRHAMRQAAFAATLDHLARAGLEDFYRGDVGREIAADLARIGSPVTRADLDTLSRHCRRTASGPAAPARSTTRRRRPRASLR